MARRNDHSRDEIRAMALAAAERILEEEGYRSLSARKIAKEIGYTVGTLYLVFENVDDLVLQLNGQTVDQLYTALSATVTACDQPKACLLSMGHAYVDFAMRNRSRWRLIFEYEHPDDLPLPAWYQEKVGRMFALVETQLVALLGERSSLKAALGARALWCGVHGICSLTLGRKMGVAGVDSVQALTDSLINNYLAGLVKSKVG